ncbi:MAG: iron-containing alcohol dehydrogenase family protein [Helicobacteraceae bacterium]|jgi:glycerol-1-phosphate dehydrogenase [NAD(P)+]|nr:iron-containing alcohol dehydrogenase family protein [Helicobacteraceae bacterium]
MTIAPIAKQINIPYLLKIGAGKIGRIGKYLFDKEMKKIAVFLGKNTLNLIEPHFSNAISEYRITILKQKTVESIELEAIAHAAFSLPSEIDAIVGVGGGKTLDAAKYAAFLLQKPCICAPTILSNDGFCSSGSSLLVEGKRKSVKSKMPFGVVIDLDIIKGSPASFLYSGAGDMVSKITALFDWKEAFNRGYERFNDFASMLAYNSLDLLFLKHSFDIYAPEFQRSLASSLTISGIAMEVAGSSRPASGSEHLISHALDSICAKPKLHGVQAAIASYLCALLQNNPNAPLLNETLEKIGFWEFAARDPIAKEEFIAALKSAPSIKSDYYTILSESDSYERALALIETDKTLKRAIV